MSTTTFSGPVASQNGFVAPTFTSSSLPYYTTGNIVYVADLNTLAFGGEDQWYRQDTGAGLGTGGSGGEGSGTVVTFRYYMNMSSTADFTYFQAYINGSAGPSSSNIEFTNLSMYPEAQEALLALPVGTVLTIDEGSSGITPGMQFTMESQFTDQAGNYRATTTTTTSFMGGMSTAYYITATY
jgi:hypothetical protein